MVDLGVAQQWVSIAAGVATVALVFFLWRAVQQMDETVRLSRIQVTHRFRPWIGPSSGIELMNDDVEGKHQFVIKLKNYGELPASNVKAMSIVSNSMPTRDLLKNAQGWKTFNLGPLLPNMEKRYWFFIDSEHIKKLGQNDFKVFVLLYFPYDYMEGKSGYGMISKFDSNTRSFVHTDMWVD